MSVTCQCPGPDESSERPPILFKIYLNITISSTFSSPNFSLSASLYKILSIPNYAFWKTDMVSFFPETNVKTIPASCAFRVILCFVPAERFN